MPFDSRGARVRTQAVVLAGGLGTRLGELAKHTPKPMVSVAGQPFLHWQLRYLQEQGLSDVLLLISHLGHVIREHFERRPMPGLNLQFALEAEPLGTGGALANALPQLADEFFLINGDSFLPANLQKMREHVLKHPWTACIATLIHAELVPVPGNIEVRGDTVARFKKGGGREQGFPYVDAGVYYLRREMIEKGPRGRFDLEAYWPALIARQKLGVFPVSERFFDIGTPERLRQFEEHLHDYF